MVSMLPYSVNEIVFNIVSTYLLFGIVACAYLIYSIEDLKKFYKALMTCALSITVLVLILNSDVRVGSIFFLHGALITILGFLAPGFYRVVRMNYGK